MIESKIMETTKSILKDFGSTYFSEKGALKRNKVIEDLDAYTPMLMKALLANKLIHNTYTEILVVNDQNIEIFKLNQFIEMFTYKEYWEDSYTKFENKIGLTVGGKFIDETADVVLDFPFKDTVLKAGMTKEDQKDADEPFLHETIAKAEIDELLEPKIFVNATKYDQEHLDGEAVNDFNDENLIIQGNNLIALHSLKKQYAGRVKLIYLDPPYNTGSDSFMYNDKFSRSSWLSFMKNRLEIAFELLSEEGFIFVQIDEKQEAYLKVLMYDIFGSNNFRNSITWRKLLSAKSQSLNLSNVTEYIIVFAKSEASKMNSLYFPLDGNDSSYSKIETNTGRKYGSFDFTQSGQGDARIFGEHGLLEPPKGKHWIWSQDKINEGIANKKIEFTKNGTPRVKRYLDEKKGNPISDLWIDSEVQIISSNDKQRVKEFDGQKPEALIKRIIELSTTEDDIVLDFFMGTATTQSIAMKMKRRFIGIEQMDYIKTVSVERLKKVIAGEQGGISKDVNWQGGGSFVYAELMEKNQGYLKDVQHATTIKELEDVVQRMIEGGADFDFRVDMDKVLQDPEYKTMHLDDKKRLIIKVIDKNQLYYSYSDIDDSDVQELMSESDIAFNKSFYGERDR